MSGRWYSGIGDSFQSDQYSLLSDDDYELFLEPNTIKKYLYKIRIIQNRRSVSFYPSYKFRIKKYLNILSSNLNSDTLKYKDHTDIDRVCSIISNLGKSGYSYIENVDKVIKLNRPVLLFYGIEHITSFYMNLHLNFTEINQYLKKLKRTRFYGHGIDPFNFNSIPMHCNLDQFLDLKIKLLKSGLPIRFFLMIQEPLEYYFYESELISLSDLLHIFFRKLRIGISDKIRNLFLDEFGRKPISLKKIHDFNNLDLLVFYLLSFLLSHLARYRINTWKSLLIEEKRNIGYFINFILKTIRKMYIRRIFSLIYQNNDNLKLMLRRIDVKENK